ncbi:unnamed protein product [Penicillium glandicola]
MASHPPSVSGVNPYPTCLLCGVQVWKMDYCSRKMNPNHADALLKETQWKKHRKAKLEHVMVSSKEVEEADLAKFPTMWSCVCRAIIKGPTTKFFLSGITVIGENRTESYLIPIPKNPSMARIGGRTHNLQYDDDTFIQFYAASITKQLNRFKGEHMGFVVHAHCWALLNHIIPTKVVQKKMDKFVRVARKYWRDNESWGSNDYFLRHWKGQPRIAYPGFEYGCDIYMNPLIIPEVQKAIENAKKAKKKRVQHCYSNIPLEVAIMIAEWTCPIDYTPADAKNTRNMLSACQWELPGSFWKRRLNEDIFLELNSLREAEYSIDWQALRLDLMALLSDREWYLSSGLANRERVLGFMTAIKSIFLEIP